jgi:1,5-anhydro-D-fructose reductase (1,5-anhydro-D-mannitol-forming)
MKEALNMREINWGVIGLGQQVTGNVIPAMEEAEGVRLAAICLSSEDKARAGEERYPGVRTFFRIDDFLSEGGIEAVYIATPHQLHVPHAFQAIEAKKHVLMEKPLSLSVDGARKLVEAARKQDVLIGVGYQLHQHPGIKSLKQMIENMELGRVRVIIVNLHHQVTWPQNWWRQTLHAGPTALMDLGVHGLDLVLWLRGEPAADVLASAQADESQDGLITMVSMIVNFKDEAQALVTASSELPGSLNQLVIVGTQAQVTASLEWPPSHKEQRIIVKNAQGMETRKVMVDNLFVKELQSFCQAIQEGTPFSPTGAENLPVVELTCAAIEAINSKRLVRCGEVLRVSG